MTLISGTRIGPHEIIAPIGAGGMGEVYRARDTKLERDVAIKVLPEQLASDPERLARFEREAKLLASLNHPNIASIHGFEESDGVNALVLEFVEGPTLAERIERGPIPVDEALAIARQIAEALEAGHEAGVIHRDLKPANIKLKKNGTVKVLDYGLAKAFEGETPEATNSKLSQSPTLTRRGTQVGVILGTAAYMSPEQARGERVDKRADIFAFGAVLYEMLAGQRAFDGESVGDVLASVIKVEPNWNVLPTALAPSIEKLLHRCLEKDPRCRLRDIGDARLEIDEAGAETSALVNERRLFRVRALVMTSVATAVLTAVVMWTFARPERAAPPNVTHAAIPYPPDAELQPTYTPSLAVSPDGRRVAYRVTNDDRSQIYVRSLGEREGRPIEGTENALMPFFSPDGAWLAFQGSTALMKISLSGGAPIRIADVGNTELRGADWSVDGTIYFSGSLGAGISRVSEQGGAVETLTVPDRDRREKSHRYPKILPGGRGILFTIGTGDIQSFDDASIAWLSLETGEYRTLVEGGTNPHYSPSGHLVYGRGGELVALPWDLDTMSATGAPVSVLSGVASSPIAGSVEFDLATDGTLVYASGDVSRKRRIVWIDRDGNVEPAVPDLDDFYSVDVSPDGELLAAFVGRANNNIWVYELDRGTVVHRIQLFDSHFPVFSRDGDRVVFSSNLSGVLNIYAQAADGSTPAERLTASDYAQNARSWSPDGKWMAFEESHPDTGWDLWLLPLGGEREPRPYLQTGFDEQVPRISPDGQLLAYQSNERGRNEVFVGTFPEPSRRWQVSTEGGHSPLWNPNGGELLYMRGRDVMAVEVTGGNDLEIGSPRTVFASDDLRTLEYNRAGELGFAIAPDGERIAMIAAGEPAKPITRLELVLNWAERLPQRVPSE